MATPYLQLRLDEVPSTQDVARDALDRLPLLVIARSQTMGRGRSGAGWVNADRALAASLAFRHHADDHRPHSLVAGLAAVAAAPGTSLKWPNDVLKDGYKVGGILVERSRDVTTIGLGLNLWWPNPPEGAGALRETDPGPDAHLELGALWGAELMERIESESWDRDAYREICVTLGREITWEPDGSGTAIDVSEHGELVVTTDSGEQVVRSGAVRHVRG